MKRPLENRARSQAICAKIVGLRGERDGDTRPPTHVGTVFGGEHERQKWLMRGFQCPDAVESGIVGKARHGGHLIKS